MHTTTSLRMRSLYNCHLYLYYQDPLVYLNNHSSFFKAHIKLNIHDFVLVFYFDTDIYFFLRQLIFSKCSENFSFGLNNVLILTKYWFNHIERWSSCAIQSAVHSLKYTLFRSICKYILNIGKYSWISDIWMYISIMY